MKLGIHPSQNIITSIYFRASFILRLQDLLNLISEPHVRFEKEWNAALLLKCSNFKDKAVPVTGRGGP
jgi:hypothetical protein